MAKEKVKTMPACYVDDENMLTVCWSFKEGYLEIKIPEGTPLEWFYTEDHKDNYDGTEGEPEPIDFNKVVEQLIKIQNQNE